MCVCAYMCIRVHTHTQVHKVKLSGIIGDNLKKFISDPHKK